MRRIGLPFFRAGLSALAMAGVGWAGAVTTAYTSTSSAIQNSACVVPPKVTSFPPTTQTVYLYIEADNVNVGDSVNVQWTDPNQQPISTPQYPAFTQVGNYCLSPSLSMTPWTPGTWTINIHWTDSGVLGYTATTVTFTITAAGAPKISVASPFNVGSATVGSPVTNTLAIGNTGTANLTVQSLTFSDSQFTAPGAPLPLTVLPNATQNVTLQFLPTKTGLQTATLSIGSNDPTNSGVTKVSVTGTGNASGGGTSSCAYNPQQPDPTTPIKVGASGSANAFLQVTTASTCTWAVSSSQSWITINFPPPPSTGQGAVTVTYSVAANPTGSAARTGQITFAYPYPNPTGSIVYTIAQDAGVACTYTLPVTSGPTPPVPATGGSGYSFALQASDSSCQWTAAADAQSKTWITVDSPSGKGTGTVTYDVAAYNAAVGGSARSGTIVAGGQSYMVTQSAPAAAGPSIPTGGIANAASFVSGDSSGPGIAQGSYISIFGTGLGPAQWAKANTFPLATSLGGVSVKLFNSTTSVDAIPTFVSNSQINAIVPSNAPLGSDQLTVTYNGVTGAPAPIKIVRNAFGSFMMGAGSTAGVIQNANPGAAEFPINSAQFPAIPGTTIAIVWGTGLGPNLASDGVTLLPDNVAPPGGNLALPNGKPFHVSVTLGGADVGTIAYAGRSPGFPGIDVVYFTVPKNAVTGCAVPVLVTVEGVVSNSVTMSVDPSGTTCSNSTGTGGSGTGGSYTNNPGNPFGLLLASGNTKLGMALVMHANAVNVPLFGNMTMDMAMASFVQINPNASLSPVVTNLPNLGSCTSMSLANVMGSGDVSSAASGMAGLIVGGSGATYLDAGKTLTLYKGVKSGSTDTRAQYVLSLDPTQPSNLTYTYDGGSFQTNSAFVTADHYELDGAGGSGVGAFSVPFDGTGFLNFASNAPGITSVDTSKALHITWTGGDPTTEAVMIAGGNTDPNDSTKTDGFVCLAPMQPGSFDVPAQYVVTAPKSASDAMFPDGMLMVVAQPYGTYPTFTATGLDKALVTFAMMDIDFVYFK